MPLFWAPQHHMLIINDEVTMSEGFPGGSVVKNLTASAGDMGLIPDPGRSPLEEDMATNSSILAWRIPWTEEPGSLQSMGLQRVGHN